VTGDNITLKRIYADRYAVLVDGQDTGYYVSSRTEDIWPLVDQALRERAHDWQVRANLDGAL
jgi:hypothetical protein